MSIPEERICVFRLGSLPRGPRSSSSLGHLSFLCWGEGHDPGNIPFVSYGAGGAGLPETESGFAT